MTIKIIEVAQIFEGVRLKYPRVKLGIEAPANFYIIREELLDG